MKTILAVLALSFSTVASSACYMIFAPNNELMWRGTAPPVNMDSPSLQDEVGKIVPHGHLVISNEVYAPCPALDLTTPRKTMRDRAEEMKYDKGTPSSSM